MHLKPTHLFALTALLLMGFVSTANAKTQRTISVMGTSTTQVVPDMVVWKISTSSSSKSLATAKADSDRKIKAVLATARSLGTAQQDVQTGHLAIQRNYENGKFSTQRSVRSYSVTREVTIIQRNIARFDEVLSRLIQAANMEVRYTLESSQFTYLRDQTRLNAVKAAKKKARDMAGALGVKLGQILTVTEDAYRGGYHQPITNTVNSYQEERNYGRLSEVSYNPSTMAPGTIDVKVSVATVFELR